MVLTSYHVVPERSLLLDRHLARCVQLANTLNWRVPLLAWIVLQANMLLQLVPLRVPNVLLEAHALHQQFLQLFVLQAPIQRLAQFHARLAPLGTHVLLVRRLQLQLRAYVALVNGQRLAHLHVRLVYLARITD